MNLSLTDAFGRFGAKPTNRARGSSAIADDGAMVLNCAQARFRHPEQGVLRYEDTVSKEGEPATSKDAELLARNLALALSGSLPIRMIVCSLVDGAGGTAVQRFNVRPDLVGKVVNFDGDRFVVDFRRREELRVASGRRK
jgi:hypothetical protein